MHERPSLQREDIYSLRSREVFFTRDEQQQGVATIASALQRVSSGAGERERKLAFEHPDKWKRKFRGGLEHKVCIFPDTATGDYVYGVAIKDGKVISVTIDVNTFWDPYLYSLITDVEQESLKMLAKSEKLPEVVRWRGQARWLDKSDDEKSAVAQARQRGTFPGPEVFQWMLSNSPKAVRELLKLPMGEEYQVYFPAIRGDFRGPDSVGEKIKFALVSNDLVWGGWADRGSEWVTHYLNPGDSSASRSDVLPIHEK